MAATTTTVFPVSVSAGARRSTRYVRSNRRRRINPNAGRALEILGHAIEYLTDEYVHCGGLPPYCNDQLETVQLLMALNREIYFDCPEVPTIWERFLSLIRLHAA